MAEQPHLEDLSRAVADGLLAEEMVYATSRLLRGEPLDQDAKTAIANGKRLLEFVAAPHHGPPRAASHASLATDESALETLRAMRLQAPNEDVRNYMQRLVEVLRRALRNEDVANDHESLETIRELFAGLSRFTLARANAISRAPEERLNWTATRTISGSSSKPRAARLISN